MNQNAVEIIETESAEEIQAIEPEMLEQLELPGMPEPIEISLTIEQIVDQILDAMKLTEFTMYQVAKALNAVLETIDATKGTDEQGEPAPYRVRPQMVYNYNRNKMIVPKETVAQVSLIQARTWIIKFASKFAK